MKKLNQSDLAGILKIGQSTMSDYETGAKQPPISILLQVADYFNVSLDYLAGRTNIKFTVESLQEMLITESGAKIPINDLVHLKDAEKEIVASFIKVINQYNIKEDIPHQNKKHH